MSFIACMFNGSCGAQEMLYHTSNPRTPSKSPTAFANVSHMFRNALCRKIWMGTSALVASVTLSLGAKVSPAQKHVL